MIIGWRSKQGTQLVKPIVIEILCERTAKWSKGTASTRGGGIYQRSWVSKVLVVEVNYKYCIFAKLGNHMAPNKKTYCILYIDEHENEVCQPFFV